MLTIDDVKKILITNNVPEESYSLAGGLPNERYCIVNTGLNWEVYYSERGLQTGLRSFRNEYEACKYFLKQLKKAGLLNE